MGLFTFPFSVTRKVTRAVSPSPIHATVGVELLPHLEREAKARQRAAGGDRGNQYTGGKVAVDQKFYQPPLPETTARAAQSLDIAAKLTGTNRQYVADAKKLKEQNPEVFEQVKASSDNQ